MSNGGTTEMRKLTGWAVAALAIVTWCFGFWAFFLFILSKAFV